MSGVKDGSCIECINLNLIESQKGFTDAAVVLYRGEKHPTHPKIKGDFHCSQLFFFLMEIFQSMRLRSGSFNKTHLRLPSKTRVLEGCLIPKMGP